MSTEIVPYYTEAQRDELENRRELLERHSNGITVAAYWLVRENVTLIYVHDERVDGSVEFEVPSNAVMDNFMHPFANKQCKLATYSQSENQGQ